MSDRLLMLALFVLCMPSHPLRDEEGKAKGWTYPVAFVGTMGKMILGGYLFYRLFLKH